MHAASKELMKALDQVGISLKKLGETSGQLASLEQEFSKKVSIG